MGEGIIYIIPIFLTFYLLRINIIPEGGKMTRGKEGKPKIIEVSAPVIPLSPLFSNIVNIHSHPGIVMLDFAYISPGFSEPHSIEETQIARICIPWDAAELLLTLLNDTISEHTNRGVKTKSKKTNKK